MSPREAHELMTSACFVYLDVRTQPEFDEGHPPGAYNVPLQHAGDDGLVDNHEFVAQVRALFSADAGIVVGCAAGVRSLRAAQVLEESGFTNLVEQRAGMSGIRDAFGRVRERGWRDEGLPLA